MSEHDYPIGDGDNDNYQNRCIQCGVLFLGHKRSMACRKCSDAGRARWESLTQEQRDYEIAQALVKCVDMGLFKSFDSKPQEEIK